MKRFLVIAITCVLTSSLLQAQPTTVSATMDSTILLVGEQTRLTFTVAQMRGRQVCAPVFPDTIVSGLEIVERLPLDTQLADDGLLLVSQSYVLTSFDSALYFIDAQPFVDGADTLYSNPLSLKVVSIPVDTAQHAIADIKPVYAPPFDWPLFWLIVLITLGVVVLAVIGFFVYRYVKRHAAPSAEGAEPQDLRPAHEIALERLDVIKAEKLWQQNRAKEYHTQLTDVVRDYIARRFGICAVEQTSAEILAGIQPELSGQKTVYADLKTLLTTSDLVKFAKYKPLVSEDEKSLALAYQFVEATKEVAPDADTQTVAESSNESK
ncbi:MAG: hypothetical protein PUK04_05255 [Bacteroidales bacterium]|nr:hypothetical protein [Bacteroidales bacterium]MDY6037090.1 hypothetical protein [Paludibacteraceae bacterium]